MGKNKVNKIIAIYLISIFSLLSNISIAKDTFERGNLKDVINFYQITANIGTGGQPTISQFSKISEAGYSVVINLAMHNSNNAIAEEGEVVSALGMEYAHIPVPFEAPTSIHLKKFFDLMDSFDGKKIFVHCAVNARASVFMHKYLTLQKRLPFERSISPYLNQWLPTMDSNWRRMMEMEWEEIK